MKVYKNYTPSLNTLCLLDHVIFTECKILNRFTTRLDSSSGRNHHGKITVRHRKNYNKKKYLYLDNFNRNFNIPSKVLNVFYDANRSSFVSLVRYVNGIYNYRILIYKNFIGNYYTTYNNIPEYIKVGDSSLIKYISPGTIICNIEKRPSSGSQITKSAGCFAILLRKTSSVAFIKLSSSSVITLSVNCIAGIGMISNKNKRYINLGKAGRSVYNGIRPYVRGVAMNPIDHPHGGGEGRKSKDRFPKTYKGKRVYRKQFFRNII